MTGVLGASVRALLDQAVEAYAEQPQAAQLSRVREQLDGPLTVAFAGRLKAGKSTLLNALVGEPLAATDATECTRVVTWYVSGPATRAWAHPTGGSPEQVRFSRVGGQTRIELGPFRPEQLDRLVVETPNSRLRRMSLVDTPGLASTSTEVSARTEAFLVDSGPGVDAVLYLMRHVHTADVGFLESFHDEAFAGTPPVNAIGVLSRVDEMAGGSANTLDVAAAIAQRYAEDDRVRTLVQSVVPVSGLLALAAVQLTEPEYAWLAQLAGSPQSALLSADRLLRADLTVPVDARRALLDGFGLFGIRHSVGLIRMGRAPDAATLSTVLRDQCGLERLRTLLVERFMGRAEVLKAESALRVLEATLDSAPIPAAGVLRERIDAVVAGAHELTELRMLTALRIGTVELDDAGQLAEVERLLGADGDGVRARLGIGPEVAADDVRPLLISTIQRWQRLSQNPFAGGGVRRVAAVIRRTCEGLL